INTLPEFPSPLSSCYVTWAGTAYNIEKCLPPPPNPPTQTLQFTDTLHFALVSLPEFRKTHGRDTNEPTGKLDRLLWVLSFVGGKRGKEIPKWLESDGDLASILAKLRFLSLTEDEMWNYEAELKEATDESAAQESAREEGMVVGREEEGKAAALRMRDDGLSIGQIAKYLGRDEEQIRAWL
ncbi:hypothetical protein HK097_010131, partial [Rhizophlyctis rosea]